MLRVFTLFIILIDNDNYKELIGIQKWIALGETNNFEAWCELRCLDYPKFTTVTDDNIYDEAITPSGAIADSIIFYISFNDDTYPAQYRFSKYCIAGYRYSGLSADE